MTFIRNAIISLCCVLLLPALSRAEPWRGIVPLHSTRSDVERLLGKPSEATEKLLTYRFESETVFILLITEDTPGIDTRVFRPGVVKEIQVMTKHTLRLADLGLDEKRVIFIKGSRPEFTGFSGYVDEEAGLIVKMSGVPTVFYFASAKDRTGCASCSIDPQSLADIPICVLCPTVAVSCPEEIKVGERATFTASLTSGPGSPKETFNWTVTDGKIVYGQGTPSITVDTTEVKGETITATVEVGGIDPVCNRTSSCSTQVTKRSTERPPNQINLLLNISKAACDARQRTNSRSPGIISFLCSV
jgi:hypothetical protein